MQLRLVEYASSRAERGRSARTVPGACTPNDLAVTSHARRDRRHSSCRNVPLHKRKEAGAPLFTENSPSRFPGSFSPTPGPFTFPTTARDAAASLRTRPAVNWRLRLKGDRLLPWFDAIEPLGPIGGHVGYGREELGAAQARISRGRRADGHRAYGWVFRVHFHDA
jgi:hypothetical protein